MNKFDNTNNESALTKQFKSMDVLGCNKAMTTKQAIGKHQMNLQKGAGGQKFH